MKKRLLALVLCCAVVIGLVPAMVTAAFTDNDWIEIVSGGEAVSSVTISEGSETTVSAQSSATGDIKWQIQVPDTDTWVNIQGASESNANSSDLRVSYGLVANMLDRYDEAHLRVVLSNDVDNVMIAELTVAVEYGVETSTTTDEPQSQPQVIDEGYVEEYFYVEDDGLMLFSDEELETMDETPDVKKTYNIVINYLFEDGEIVTVPYTATLAEGDSLHIKVTFPTVQGYLPYVGTEQLDYWEYDYVNISEDVTINVVYSPALVDYTVIHYQQNVNDNDYTEKERETKLGETESIVEVEKKDYEGFYSLIYEEPPIAADGSTVIEVYYDRYYYLMNFDMDGGYGTDPVYARYGADIGTVNDPTKPGYTFLGWSETKGGTTAVEIPETMPAVSKTYYAIWEVDATAKVTIVFWGENADDEGYSYLDGYTKEIYKKPGTEFTYSESGMLVCDKEVHTHSFDEGCYELVCNITEHTHNDDICLACVHTHTVDCFKTTGNYSYAYGSLVEVSKPSQVLTAGRDGIYTYTTTESGWGGGTREVTHYYLNIGDKWYCGGYNTWQDETRTEDKTEITLSCSHEHTDDCYKDTAHTHSVENGCYKLVCTKEEHTHDKDCYMSGAGLDSTLWKFVRSDTVTVAADGTTVVNVYYDRTTFKLSFYNKNGNTLHGTIEDKWDAQIGDRFLAINEKANGNLWMTTRNGDSGPYTAFLEVMPSKNITYYLKSTSSSEQKAYYYVEKLDGSGYDTKYTVIAYSSSSLHPTEEDFIDINGFTFQKAVFKNDWDRDVTVTSKGTYEDYKYNNSQFYYTRNSYKLVFNNGYEDKKTEKVKYEAPLSTYKDYVPEAPTEIYEPGSVEFGGWYQNPECTGEEYKLDEHTMPSHDIILYAKWVPVTRKVEFYLTESSTEVYKPDDAETAASFTVPHGGNIAKEYVEAHLETKAMNDAKPNGSYTFVMWYYYDDGVKTPFDPTTRITKDMELYGEWSANALKEYTVHYVLQSDHSVKVAKDLTGSGLAGTTKTFDAKVGTELDAAYQEGYFPTVQSQSLLLDIDSNSLEITFEYVPAEVVPYTVCYVTAETVDEGTTTYGTVVIDGNSYTKLAEDYKNEENRKAVVTETFKPISGYMPDAYQKRLVVTADGESVLYFYYTKDTTHAYYKITHLTQNLDGETWTEYASSQAVGDINDTMTASPMTIPGFVYDHWTSTVGSTESADNDKSVKIEKVLTAEGLEFRLYYVREQCEYKVFYLQADYNAEGGHDQVAATKTANAMYGDDIVESAISVSGWKAVSSETKPGSYSTATTRQMKADVPKYEDGELTNNIIIFYYERSDYSLTIKKTGASDVDVNQTFVFHVKGNDTNNSHIDMEVVVHGNGEVTIKDLPYGSYTVTEESNLSWRYNTDPQTFTLDGDKTITFNNTRENDKWLDGSSSAENVWSGDTVKRKED